jgi:hypothetical protein
MIEDSIIQLIKDMIKIERFGQVNDAAFDGTNKVAEMMNTGSTQNYLFILDCFGDSQMGTKSRDSVLPAISGYLIGFHKDR